MTGTTNDNVKEAWEDGFFYLSYDFTTSLSAGAQNMVPRVRSGVTRLSLTWDVQLPVEVSVLVYSEFSSVCEINAKRQVKINLY